MQKYVVNRVLSNNVLMVESGDENHILIGKGIGFGKKKGSVIDNLDKVEEQFISLKGLDKKEHDRFISQIDPSVIEVVNDVLQLFENTFDVKLNSANRVGLIDHVNFAVKRIREGVEIVNPFLFETEILYPEEYDLAKKAIESIENALDINIPKAEIGFLTLHFYGGRSNTSKTKALEHSKMMNSIIGHVDAKIEGGLDKNSFFGKRFIFHLLGVMNRVMDDKTTENLFMDQIKNNLTLEFKLAYDIAKIMEQTLRKPVPESEMGYIAMHLHKLSNK